jgi:O-antigen/teichoic acid export membrane protein
MLLSILRDREHPFWVLLQQFVSRGFIGLKFLILARILGPHSIGLISVALVSLAIIESVTQLGIMETVVQRKGELKRKEIDAIWTLQFVRGMIIGTVMFLLSPLLAKIFDSPDSLSLLYTISLLPIISNSISIRLYQNLRKKNFKTVSIIELSTVILDLIFSIILVKVLNSPIGVILGQIISQTFKVSTTHLIFKTKPKLCIDMKLIKDINSYGKWIWANSVSSLILNQFDKILASRFLGATTLGYYQMSQKFTQMGVTDISFAIGQYHFPIFSKLNREKNVYLSKAFFNMFYLIVGLSISTSIFIYTNSELIISLTLGHKWMPMIPLLKLMLLSASLAAVMNVSVVFLRSIGKPNIVTISSYIQLICYIPLAIIGVSSFEEIGLVIANIVALIIANIILFVNSFRNISSGENKNVIIHRFFSLLSTLPIAAVGVIFNNQNLTIFIVSSLIYFPLVIKQLLILRTTILLSRENIAREKVII